MIYLQGEFAEALTDINDVSDIIVFNQQLYTSELALNDNSINFINLVSKIKLWLFHDLQDFEAWIFDRLRVTTSQSIIIYGLIDDNELNGGKLNYFLFLLSKLPVKLYDKHHHTTIDNFGHDLPIKYIIDKWTSKTVVYNQPTTG